MPRPRDAALLLLRVTLTVGALGWALRRVDLSVARTALAEAPLWAFFVPPALMLVNSALHALRTGLLLDALGVRAPPTALLGAMLKGNFAGIVLPGGGAEVAKAGFLARITSADAAVVALVTARVLEFVPWALLLLYGLAWGLAAWDPALGGAAAAFAGAFLAVSGATALGVRWGPTSARRLPGRVGVFGERAASALTRLSHRPARLALVMALALPFKLINGLSVWAVLHAYAVPLPYADVLAIFPAADALISLPITINGVGVREGVFARALAPLGTPAEVAVAAALTRWCGELGRAAVGGLWFLIDGLGRRELTPR
ncbi:MAG: flippase-like domain-containing protein [Alphaproteobacteria bacterium]|nr:flippase-like domain-containing protein [Alphaproteobacteria bacterium]